MMELETYVDTDVMKRDVQIDPTDLDNMMIRHPSLYVHYAAQTVRAKKQYDKYKNMMGIVEAKLDKKYRDALTEGGVKKTTENAIRNAILSDRSYIAMQEKVLDAQEIYRLCEVAESAFVQRKDLILEIARDRRKEREGQMRVMEQASLRDSVRNIISND